MLKSCHEISCIFCLSFSPITRDKKMISNKFICLKPHTVYDKILYYKSEVKKFKYLIWIYMKFSNNIACFV